MGPPDADKHHLDAEHIDRFATSDVAACLPPICHEEDHSIAATELESTRIPWDGPPCAA